MKKPVKWILIILALVVGGGALCLGVAQLVPYGRDHTNPPVVAEPQWDSPQTRALAKRACFDCHSNETVWPWYSNVAPVSWLVQHDVEEGRSKVNFSEWDGEEADDILEVVQRGEMPPAQYLPMHPEAKLSATEKETFLSGLEKTFGER